MDLDLAVSKADIFSALSLANKDGIEIPNIEIGESISNEDLEKVIVTISNVLPDIEVFCDAQEESDHVYYIKDKNFKLYSDKIAKLSHSKRALSIEDSEDDGFVVKYAEDNMSDIYLFLSSVSKTRNARLEEEKAINDKKAEEQMGKEAPKGNVDTEKKISDFQKKINEIIARRSAERG